jgi:hypothetical protein
MGVEAGRKSVHRCDGEWLPHKELTKPTLNIDTDTAAAAQAAAHAARGGLQFLL